MIGWADNYSCYTYCVVVIFIILSVLSWIGLILLTMMAGEVQLN